MSVQVKEVETGRAALDISVDKKLGELTQLRLGACPTAGSSIDRPAAPPRTRPRPPGGSGAPASD